MVAIHYYKIIIEINKKIIEKDIGFVSFILFYYKIYLILFVFDIQEVERLVINPF